MNGVRQGWLVARRELRERSRSKAFLASLVFMVLSVGAAIALPALLTGGGGTKDVGVAGMVPADLPATIETQGKAVGTDVRIHRYRTVLDGEQAVRDSKVDVLVIDARQLDWQRRADEQLKAVVTGAIQVVAIRERAVAAGVDPEELFAMVAPVPVDNIELGQVAGRSADDETVAYILTLVLFFAISFYGSMVLSGVIEEKASRVVEVLLARMPSRNLLAGKIAGIGLLGLAQVAATALVAVVAVRLADSLDLPAARATVIVWSVLWFVLGYALYATAFGALGSLASRAEDTSSVTGPLMVTLIVAYFVSFATIGSPYTAWARAVSWFPATAPFAMPNRIAMGAATWWDPVIALGLTAAAIVGLVVLGGRVYTHAILHTGATLRLTDAWRGTTATTSKPTTAPSPSARRSEVLHEAGPAVVALALGVAVIGFTGDVIIGITVAAIAFALGVRSSAMRSRSHR